MVDFNWYRATGTEDDWRVRAGRLRAEIDANKYWYRVVTLAVPRYETRDDAERVSILLNARMAATRKMERELAWLEQSLEPERRRATDVHIAERRRLHSADTNPGKPPGMEEKWAINVPILCIIALWPLREALAESTWGSVVLVLAFIRLCYLAVNILVAIAEWVGKTLEAGREMRETEMLSETELIEWHRARRLREYHRAAERCVTTT